MRRSKHIGYRLVLAGLLLVGMFSSSFYMPYRVAGESPIKTIVIDAGHGGKDPGSVGAKYYEKDITLSVALKVKELIKEHLPQMNVVLTREDDTFIEVHKRATMAQDELGDFFVSIHCNGMNDKKWKGTETYVMGINSWQDTYQRIVAENEAILFEEDHTEMYGGFDPKSPEGFIYFKLLKDTFRKESSYLAEKVQKQYVHKLGRKDRGVKQAPFIVLYQSGMPSILTEMGFISNPDEEKFLASEVGQRYLANAIFKAIDSYNSEFKY
ncbi:MAG: N-acetylmuramoyl-L-alanine amidase [Bacteroidota bacterium]